MKRVKINKSQTGWFARVAKLFWMDWSQQGSVGWIMFLKPRSIHFTEISCENGMMKIYFQSSEPFSLSLSLKCFFRKLLCAPRQISIKINVFFHALMFYFPLIRQKTLIFSLGLWLLWLHTIQNRVTRLVILLFTKSNRLKCIQFEVRSIIQCYKENPELGNGRSPGSLKAGPCMGSEDNFALRVWPSRGKLFV